MEAEDGIVLSPCSSLCSSPISNRSDSPISPKETTPLKGSVNSEQNLKPDAESKFYGRGFFRDSGLNVDGNTQNVYKTQLDKFTIENGKVDKKGNVDKDGLTPVCTFAPGH